MNPIHRLSLFLNSRHIINSEFTWPLLEGVVIVDSVPNYTSARQKSGISSNKKKMNYNHIGDEDDRENEVNEPQSVYGKKLS